MEERRDERLIEALLALACTLGVLFNEARQIGYIRAFGEVPCHALEWACVEVLKEHVYPTMPTPGQLIRLAKACPPLPRQARPVNSQQIAEFTAQSVEESKRALARLIDGINSWQQQDNPDVVFIKKQHAGRLVRDVNDNVAAAVMAEPDIVNRRELLRLQALALGVCCEHGLD